MAGPAPAQVTFEVLDLPAEAPWADFSLSRNGHDMGCLLGDRVYWWSQGAGFRFLAGGGSGGGVGMAAGGRAMIASGNRDGAGVPTIWYRDGSSRTLGSLAGGCKEVHGADCGFDLSADGRVAVGQSRTCHEPSGFVWSADGGMRPVRTDTPRESRATAISADGRVVAGYSENPESGQRRPAVWQDGRGPDLILGEDKVGEAFGVSLDGHQVVGQADLGGLRAEAFYVATGFEPVALGSLDGRLTDTSLARAVSDDGKVVGWCGDALWGNQRAFIWTARGGMRSLDSLLDEHGVPHPEDLVLTRALDISGDGGTVVGVARDADQRRLYWRLELGDALDQPPLAVRPRRSPPRRDSVLPDSLEMRRAGSFEPFPFGKRRDMPPP